MSEPRRAPGMDSGTGFFTGPAAENVYLNRHLEFFSIREERERERTGREASCLPKPFS